MDLNKIGGFITEKRKGKGFTQNELAVKLCVTDRAVSKWECGKGLPDVSIMTPLCEVLGITINELLSGGNIAEQERAAQAEKQIMDLLRERQANKRKIWWQVTVGTVGILVLVASILAAAYLIEFDLIEIWHGVFIIIFGVVMFIALYAVTISIAVETGSYECTNCHHRFVPAASEYIKGMHIITRRKLKCPSCGKTTWCKQRLNK